MSIGNDSIVEGYRVRHDDVDSLGHDGESAPQEEEGASLMDELQSRLAAQHDNASLRALIKRWHELASLNCSRPGGCQDTRVQWASVRAEINERLLARQEHAFSVRGVSIGGIVYIPSRTDPRELIMGTFDPID